MTTKLEIEEGVYGLVESPNITKVRFGEYEIDTWYGSAVYFARDRSTVGIRIKNGENRYRTKAHKDEIWLEKLYVCDHCFKYTDNKKEFNLHMICCDMKDRELGKIVYQDPERSIRKVRGSKHKLFTQNLCLFTKLFLDNKSVFFTTDLFDFYIIYDRESNKPMGFFSKELLSPDRNNLACILVFPPYQRRHLGTLLIAFSYELSKAEQIISGPEKPLSPFGLVGYLRYWCVVISRELLVGVFRQAEVVTLEQISKTTGIRQDDVMTALKYLQVLVKSDQTIYLQRTKIKQWTIKNQISMRPLLRHEFLIIDY